MDSTSDLIWSVDSDTLDVIMFNNAVSEHYRHRTGSAMQIGHSGADIFPANEMVHDWRYLYERALIEGRYSTEYHDHDAGRVYLLTLNRLDQAGHAHGVSVFARDVTQQKAAEESVHLLAFYESDL